MEAIITNKEHEKFDNTTPIITDLEGFFDADEELLQIAEYVVQTTIHNSDIDPKRIKYLYTSDIKKSGGRYSAIQLYERKPIEKMISDEFDFIIIVSYDVWKELKGEQKIIQLDKALCGIDTGTLTKPGLKKKSPDSNEFLDNLNHYTPRRVMEITEMVHMTAQRVLEERKEKGKESKKKVQTSHDVIQ